MVSQVFEVINSTFVCIRHCVLHMKAVRVDGLTAETELNDPLSHLAENHDSCQKNAFVVRWNVTNQLICSLSHNQSQQHYHLTAARAELQIYTLEG